MIAYDLLCARGHGFEAWFRSADAFDEQVAAGATSCPVCGDSQVSKAPMAPFVTRSATARRPLDNSEVAPVTVPEAARELLAQMRRHVEENCVDVGHAFPEEARRIHYREAEPRDIYGEASESEAKALGEEGIAVHPLPWFRRRND